MSAHNTILVGESMTVNEYFDTFEIKGQGAFYGVENTDLDFVVDGWAAAVALSEALPLAVDAGDEEIVRDCLLNKKLPSNELVVESLSMLKHLPPGTHLRQYETHVEGKVAIVWKHVCGDKNLGEFAIPRGVREHGQVSEWNVRTRRPLPLPWTLHDHDQLVLKETVHDQSFEIPRSAVFFASRLHRLRQLAAVLRTVNHEASKSVRREIYSVLLSMCLYSNVMHHFEEEEPERSGVHLLDFYAMDWLNTFRAGTAAGSTTFGYAGGVGANGEFLHQHRDDLITWLGDAVKWWCPHLGSRTPSQQWADEEERKIVKEAMQEMMKELFEMFAAMHKELAKRATMPEGVVLREHDFTTSPFAAISRH